MENREKIVSEAARFFPVRPPLWGLKGASSPFLVAGWVESRGREGGVETPLPASGPAERPCPLAASRNFPRSTAARQWLGTNDFECAPLIGLRGNGGRILFISEQRNACGRSAVPFSREGAWTGSGNFPPRPVTPLPCSTWNNFSAGRRRWGCALCTRCSRPSPPGGRWRARRCRSSAGWHGRWCSQRPAHP